MFLGWVVVLIVDECVALSLGEFASKYPTSAGPYYWSFQLASPNVRTVLSFITGMHLCHVVWDPGTSSMILSLTIRRPGWTWLIGNWTITLSVNFGFASLIAATVALYHPDWTPEPWQLLLIFYAICLLTFAIVAYGNRLLPMVDTICAAFTALSILITLICLSAKASVGRHSARDTLVREFRLSRTARTRLTNRQGYYDTSLSGWGGFSFFIGILPAAYT
jgi:amino acid transporter